MARKSKICAEVYIVTPHKKRELIGAATAVKNRFRTETR